MSKKENLAAIWKRVPPFWIFMWLIHCIFHKLNNCNCLQGSVLTTATPSINQFLASLNTWQRKSLIRSIQSSIRWCKPDKLLKTLALAENMEFWRNANCLRKVQKHKLVIQGCNVTPFVSGGHFGRESTLLLPPTINHFDSHCFTRSILNRYSDVT